MSYGAAKVDNGAIFDGNTSKLQAVSSTYVTFNENWSIGCWVYPTLWTSGDFIVAKGAFPYGPRLSLWTDTYNGFSSIMASSGGDGYLVNNIENAAYQINNWYHIFLTYNSTSGDLSWYVNGDFVAKVTKTGTQQADANPFTIGQYYANNSYGFNGMIDEVGCWKRTLTADEIKYLYNQGSGLSR